jgi:hypothetical protein
VKEVTKEEFYKAIGPRDCHPHIEGPYPYTSIYYTPSRVEVGRIVDAMLEGGGMPVSSYFLPG